MVLSCVSNMLSLSEVVSQRFLGGSALRPITRSATLGRAFSLDEAFSGTIGRQGRGKDIGERGFKGTAGGQLSTDLRGEGGAAWPRPVGRVGAGGSAGPRSCGALRRAEDASAREAGLIQPESLRIQISNSNFAERSPRMDKAATKQEWEKAS